MTATSRTSIPRVGAADELEHYIAETSEQDPAFRAALEDAEELHRLLDTLISMRRDRNLNQTEVARRMGVRQPTVSVFENESGDPRLSTLQRYARAVEARIRLVVHTPADCSWVSPGTGAYRARNHASQWASVRAPGPGLHGWSAPSRLGGGPGWALSSRDTWDTVA